MKDEGKSDAEIARYISNQYGNRYPELKNISRMSIARYFEAKARAKIQEKIEDKGEEAVVKEIYEEFRKKMRALISKMEERDKLLDELIDEAKANKDYESLIEYIREQRNDIEMIRRSLVSLIQYAEKEFKPIIQIDVKKEINVRNMLLSFSNILCPECRAKVAKQIQEEL